MGLGGMEACMLVINLTVLFKDNVELPNVWDTSSETMNVDDCFINVLLKLFSK